MVGNSNAQKWAYFVTVCVLLIAAHAQGAYIEGEGQQEQRPPDRQPVVHPQSPHVPELASFLNQLEIRTPLSYRGLAVFPVVLRDEPELVGKWLSAEAAISRGVLVVTEKGGGGSVPHVVVANRSRHTHVFIMAGELISGGKQTRTVRQDVVLAPGQKVDIGVFCVERGRWSGKGAFKSRGLLVPQSMQKALRGGTDQARVWADVSRTNSALSTRSRTGNLEAGLNSAKVRARLNVVRRALVPEVPRDSIGFIFVHHGRAVGAEFFGRSYLALEYLPKLIDSYAVDFVLQNQKTEVRRHYPPPGRNVAEAYLRRIRRAGSVRIGTPGSGAGIRTRSGGLLGDGVSLAGDVVHYGAQPGHRIMPGPKPMPIPRNHR